MKPSSTARSASETSGAVQSSRRSVGLQRAVDRRHAQVEDLGHLARGPLEHVAQDQRRPLAGGEQLDHGEERQLDGLAAHDRRVGLVALRRDLDQEPVGIGLEPGNVAERPQRRHPAPGALDRV
jgi:hypothetical protein